METALIAFSDDQVNLIKKTIAKNATNDELSIFLHQAKKMGLDPLSKQIYFQKYRIGSTGESKMTIIVAIDGYRLIAARSGAYAGIDDALFEYNEDKLITKATVTVYKLVGGVRCAFTASARWDEYCPQPPADKMWGKMPYTMLAKVAEALALRKAFPAELSGTYTNEEMNQAGAVTVQATIINPETGEVLQSPSQKLTEKVSKPHSDIDTAIMAFEGLGIDENQLMLMLGVTSNLKSVDIGILRALYAQKRKEKFEKENIVDAVTS